MWMWSSACRTATHRQPPGSPDGANPVRSTTSRATVAHSASVGRRSPGAVRIEHCHSGLSIAPGRSCIGRLIRAANGPTSCRVPARTGSRSASDGPSWPRQDATRCGRVCSLDRPEPYR